MSTQQSFRRGGGAAAADECKHQAVRSSEESVFYSGSDESVYAVSSSSSSTGSSHGSSLSSADGYLHALDDCLDQEEGHYEDAGGIWEWRLAEELWTSSLLCGVSTLLAVCSLSSLAACIILTASSLMYIELSPDTVTASATEDDVEGEDIRNRPQIDVWTERLAQPPLADRISSSQQHSTQREPPKRYSWDCVAQAGHTKCSPVQKEQSRQNGVQSSVLRQYRQLAAQFRVIADGMYHISAQIAGTVWLPPPTLLRAVIARVKQKSGTANVTVAHTITGTLGGGPLATASRGTFSVYTATAVLLSAGDELQARVICVEEPECVTHVNGTSSYLTLERLD